MSAQLYMCNITLHVSCVTECKSWCDHDMWSCCRCFLLQRPRLELFERIDLRVECMVDRGLLQVGAPNSILSINSTQLSASPNTVHAVSVKACLVSPLAWQATPCNVIQSPPSMTVFSVLKHEELQDVSYSLLALPSTFCCNTGFGIQLFAKQ